MMQIPTRAISSASGILSLCLLLGTSAHAATPNPPALLQGADPRLTAQICFGCHGPDGASRGPATPTISGLSEEYFVEIMQGFRDGEIPSTIMGRIAAGFSDDEFKALAEIFGKKPFVKARQPFDPKLARKGERLHRKYCEKCHGEGGQSAEDDAGILAGQWRPYLAWTLADFIRGHREAPKKMNKRLRKLLARKGSEGLKALLHFYASEAVTEEKRP